MGSSSLTTKKEELSKAYGSDDRPMGCLAISYIEDTYAQYPTLEDAVAVTFMAYNPMTWWTAPFGDRVTAFPQAPTAKSTPIELEARASDPGVRLTTSSDTITITGRAAGPKPMKDIFGLPHGDLARSVSFTLDIEKAPTNDLWGNTDYTEKNSRIFQVMTSKGATAAQIANALAAKVNRGDDFKATIAEGQDGSATIALARR